VVYCICAWAVVVREDEALDDQLRARFVGGRSAEVELVEETTDEAGESRRELCSIRSVTPTPVDRSKIRLRPKRESLM